MIDNNEPEVTPAQIGVDEPILVDADEVDGSGAGESDQATQDDEPIDVDELTDEDRAILDFESRLWKKTAVKERAIGVELGIAPATYYQRLLALSRLPQAFEYAPATMRRLTQGSAHRRSGRFE